MLLSKFDKIGLVFFTIIVSVILVSGGVLVGGDVPANMPFHPLQFVTTGSGLTSVDTDEDGIIDNAGLAEKAEMVFCDGTYKAVVDCSSGAGLPTTCVDGDYLVKEAGVWGCTTMEEISASITTIVDFENIGCPETYTICDETTIQDNANEKWGLAALINEAHFDYNPIVDDLLGCPWGSVSPGGSTIMNDYVTYIDCMSGAGMTPLCHSICTDPEIMVDGSLSSNLGNSVPGRTFDTGFYIGGHPTLSNGLLSCSCLGYGPI